ncbi:hypothetical protein Agub_g11803, partial [Astrephomene gubernaculifera]
MDAPVGTGSNCPSRPQSTSSLGPSSVAHRPTCETHGWRWKCNEHIPLSDAKAQQLRRRHKDIAVVTRSRGSGGGDIGSSEGGDESGGGRHWRAPPLGAPTRTPCFRFWIDYQAFSGRGSAVLIERALRAAGGLRAGGPPKREEGQGAGRDE